jgi:hypothetical protein
VSPPRARGHLQTPHQTCKNDIVSFYHLCDHASPFSFTFSRGLLPRAHDSAGARGAFSLFNAAIICAVFAHIAALLSLSKARVGPTAAHTARTSAARARSALPVPQPVAPLRPTGLHALVSRARWREAWREARTLLKVHTLPLALRDFPTAWRQPRERKRERHVA